MVKSLFLELKRWPTLEIVMLRNLLHHEIERRLDCAMIGVPHTEREIEAHDEKTKAAQAVPGCDMERGAVEMASADQDALREAQEPKEST